MERDNYFERKAVSRSLLSELVRHPQRAKAMLDGVAVRVESEAMTFGSAFDSLMFDTAAEFSSKYKIRQYENPWTDRRKNTGKFTHALEQIMEDHIENGRIVEHNDMFMQAYTQSGIKSPKLEDLVAEFVELGGREWVKECMMKGDFTMISQETYNKAAAMKAILINDEYVGHLFAMDVPETHTIKDGHLEIIYQMDIAFDIEGVQCKALPDIVVINHAAKVINVYDLKTTSSYDQNVMGSMVKFGYDLQAAWYTIGVQALTFSGQKYEDYIVADDFGFIFIDTHLMNAPVNILMPESDLRSAINGGTRYGRPRKGAFQIFNDYVWHVEADKWDYPREYYENNGYIETDIYDS